MAKDPKAKRVTIELYAWTIPLLLGAARLGTWAERWCAHLAQTSCGTYDTHSLRWARRVNFIIDDIKKQTGIKSEDKEYGELIEVVDDIEAMVAEKCEMFTKALEKHYERQYKKFLKEEQEKNKSNKVEK